MNKFLTHSMSLRSIFKHNHNGNLVPKPLFRPKPLKIPPLIPTTLDGKKAADLIWFGHHPTSTCSRRGHVSSFLQRVINLGSCSNTNFRRFGTTGSEVIICPESQLKSSSMLLQRLMLITSKFGRV